MKKFYKGIVSLAVIGIMAIAPQAKAQWAPMSTGLSSGGDIYALCGSGASLYVGGGFFSPFTDIMIWNGSTYGSAGVVPSQPVNAIATWDSVTYFASDNAIYQRIGGSDLRIAIINDPCYALCVWKGKLYAGGWMDSVNHVYTGYIAVYNGSTWSSLGVGVDNWPKAMCVYNGMLAVGGYMNYSSAGDTLYGVGLWDGTKWHSLDIGIQGSGGVYAMDTLGGKLYIGGQFDSASTSPKLYHHVFANNIAAWNGSAWDSVGKGIYTTIYAMTAFNGNMVVGGYFDSIKFWDGVKWSPLGGAIAPAGSEINALTVNKGILYAGGMFNTIGGVTMNDLAQYTIPTAISQVTIDNAELKVYPNPSNGRFTVESSASNGQIEIYNVVGERIQSFRIQNSTFSIDLTSQPAGIYIYRALDKDGNFIGTGRLVIQ